MHKNMEKSCSKYTKYTKSENFCFQAINHENGNICFDQQNAITVSYLIPKLKITFANDQMLKDISICID